MREKILVRAVLIMCNKGVPSGIVQQFSHPGKMHMPQF